MEYFQNNSSQYFKSEIVHKVITKARTFIKK